MGIISYICRNLFYMIEIIFKDKDLEELIKTGYNRKYKDYARDKKFMNKLLIVYQCMRSVNSTSEFSEYSILHYEKLKYCNESSVRVMQNRIERILFTESENGIEITLLKLDNTHYGNKK